MRRRKFARRVASASPEPFRLSLKLPSDVIRLSVGEPDFATPSFVREAAKRAIDEGFTHYAPAAGYDDLRRAIAEKLRRENRINYDYETEVVVTPGSSAGIYLVFLALLQEGDEVLVPDPGWFHYSTLVSLCDATPVWTPFRSKRENSFDIDAIRKRISKRTRILILNSPSNPTGMVLSEDAIKSLGELAERHDLFIVSDEIYEKIIYPPNKHISPASISQLRERTLTSNGFAKAYAMTGWRVGYVAGPSGIIEKIVALNGYAFLGASSVSQRAAYAALTHPGADSAVNQMVERFEKRRSMILEALGNLSQIDFHPPQGAFYAWVDIRKTALSGEEFAYRLIDEKKVGVLPGVYFGKSGKKCVRISFATADDQLKQALERFGEFVRDHSRG